jgi:branched-chain amino acid transport system ATP-binding protein
VNILEVSNLSAGYGYVNVLRDINFVVPERAIVALLGANGAGKTTVLRAISGMIPLTGGVKFDGRDVGGLSAARRQRIGIAHVPQGRGTFVDFSVEENLALGGYCAPKAQVQSDLQRWYGVFPRLSERRNQLAGSLSGGEQQMLAIARALMARPRILMCDEPSMGLAPTITQEVFALLARLNAEDGMTILLVEQNANLTLRIAHYAYVLENGRIGLQGNADTLRANEQVRHAYLGH